MTPALLRLRSEPALRIAKGQGSRFDELLAEMKRIHDAKRSDYAPDDELGNFRLSELAGVPAWVGILIRLTDKVSRACAYAKKGTFAVKDEGLRDTLIDAANYALLCLIAYEEARNAKRDA